MKKQAILEAFDQAAAGWPSPFVARKNIEKFTGGLISSKTMANLDSQGLGPPSLKMGSNRGYIKTPLVKWLKKRAGVV